MSTDSNDSVLARLDRIMDRLDLRFIEAAHYDRDDSYRADSPAQVPMAVHNPEGKPSVEFYAPTQVQVLGWPVLYCMPCATEHPCAYVHKVDTTLGVCEANAHLARLEQYQQAERVAITAEQSFTGTISRA